MIVKLVESVVSLMDVICTVLFVASPEGEVVIVTALVEVGRACCIAMTMTNYTIT